MKIEYQVHGLNLHRAAHRPLDRSLERLDRLIPISKARVVLQQQRDIAPAFSALVDLAVPGPDIHAAARDHTLQAALLKVLQRLEEQIGQRKIRQHVRRKRREHCRAVSSQWSR